jgi:hypothetical protein
MNIKCWKIIFLIGLICLSAFSFVKDSPALEESREWKGSVSYQKTKYIKVVTDNEEWVALWKRAFDKKAPEIDFEHYAIACVFLGHDADWLYSISFGKPFEKEGRLIIPYGLAEIILELAAPFKASGQYHMKVLKKEKGLDMILEEVKYR